MNLRVLYLDIRIARVADELRLLEDDGMSALLPLERDAEPTVMEQLS